MKNINPKISIIVPVYKVEKYLNRCLESIIAQTFTDWECILIDDGSPDNCGKICDEYAKKDERFIVIHQENAGVSAARNAGLDVAKGDYISFVDSDDWVESIFLEVQYNDIVSRDYDVCICGFVGKGKVINRELSVIEAKKNLFTPKGFLGFPFLKIINSQKIQGLRFDPSITYCEDTDFFYRLFSKCNKILWTDKPLYYYENNPNSVTRGIGFTSQVQSKFDTIEKLYYTEKNRIIRHSILCYNILAHYWACYLHIMYKRDSFDENYKNAIYFCRKNFFKFLFDIRYSWNIKIFLFYICFFKRPEKTLLIKYLINKYQRLNIIKQEK